ncbi:MAG: tyrosine recombinase [Verrucomicrobiota bacterium]|jgi:integrase/recombinase XerD|nr:tyrosine recombinase [Verrucomicrobiota bacterium]MDI9385089.1 tyrosine recombinase [Verrucomicrobiota bacterium]
MQADDEIDLFLGHLTLERGLSPLTAEAYAGDLAQFLCFLEERGITRVDQIRPSHIRDFLDHCQTQQELSSATLARRVSAIRAWMHFLIEIGTSMRMPDFATERPRVDLHLPKYLSKSQVEVLLTAPFAPPESRFPHRDRAILELLYSCGLRATEICTLKSGDIDLTSRFLRCFGKRGKERVVPFGPQAAEAIDQYNKNERGKLLKNGECVQWLLSHSGRPLLRNQIWRIVRAAAQKVQLPNAPSPHVLRHSFATHMLSSGADLRSLQELLGHANLNTTQIYAHIENPALQKAHNRFHPRAARPGQSEEPSS